MTRRTSNCHPGRPHRALGLCSPCWWRQYRGSTHREPYGKILVEELDFEIWTWDELEEKFGAKRREMARRLVDLGRPDLPERIKIKTYGTTDPNEIKLVRNRRARK